MNNYPRPELVRKEFVDLNGIWKFDFDFTNSLKEEHPLTAISENITYNIPNNLEKKINVPFAPESELSGLGYKGFVVACWYEKTIEVKASESQRAIIHFEAVFHTAHIFIDDKLVCIHKGGYTPFSIDITDYVKNDKVTIKLHAYGDPRNGAQPSGKQSPKTNSYGCFYSRSTGIWQSVWLEYVPKNYLKNIKMTSDVANGKLDFRLALINDSDVSVTLTAKLDGKIVGQSTYKARDKNADINGCINLSTIVLWDIDNPKLYDLLIEIKSKYGTDECLSYFGMREIRFDNKGIILNNKRVFLRFVLDQGYYKDGLYTVLNDEDFIAQIDCAKAMGFNGARLHQRVFDRRYLHFADKKGFLVWGEYPSWGFDHSSDAALLYYLPEWLEAVKRDYNHPSVITWCIMNENFDYKAKRQNPEFIRQLYRFTKEYDNTRPVVDVSWNYHVITDIYDVHDYSLDEEFIDKFSKFEDGKIFDSMNLNQKQYENEPYILSEFGGLKYPIGGDGWGYNAKEISSSSDVVDKICSLVRVIYNNPRICGMCYTQLYDVEQEQNGLYYDHRGKAKFTCEEIKKLNDAVSTISEYEKIDN